MPVSGVKSDALAPHPDSLPDVTRGTERALGVILEHHLNLGDTRPRLWEMPK